MVKKKYVFAASFAAGAVGTTAVLRSRRDVAVNILIVRPGDPRPNIVQVHKADVILAEVNGQFQVVKGSPTPDAVTLVTPQRYFGSNIRDILDQFNRKQ
jgi:hypothetical protein